ncbi:MAG: hypothetical protein AB1861_29565 [Cyanobacteriota bacterium]
MSEWGDGSSKSERTSSAQRDRSFASKISRSSEGEAPSSLVGRDPVRQQSLAGVVAYNQLFPFAPPSHLEFKEG